MSVEVWQAATHPYEMIYFKECRDDRKRRLVSCACTRAVLKFLPSEPFVEAVEFAERMADGHKDDKLWGEVRKRLRAASKQLDNEPAHHAAGAVLACTEKQFMSFKMAIESASFAESCLDRSRWDETGEQVARTQCDYVRDIFGDPFAPIAPDPDWSKWSDGTVPRLAEEVYESRSYEAIPILGDALQDAGCDNQDVLNHCYQGGPHVRGCWVVDLFRPKTQ